MGEEILSQSDLLMQPPLTNKVFKSTKDVKTKFNKSSKRYYAANSSHRTCKVCNEIFKCSKYLRYHIRKTHFNLKASVPHAQISQVNQVWFEKVQNSNKIVEIKKTAINSLVMRTVDENASDSVDTIDSEKIDLSDMYPVLSLSKHECVHCKKSFLKKEFKRHVKESHPNKKKQVCSKCSKEFERVHMYLKHKCGRLKTGRGRHVKNEATD